jgi:hypothetical protein
VKPQRAQCLRICALAGRGEPARFQCDFVCRPAKEVIGRAALGQHIEKLSAARHADSAEDTAEVGVCCTCSLSTGKHYHSDSQEFPERRPIGTPLSE